MGDVGSIPAHCIMDLKKLWQQAKKDWKSTEVKVGLLFGGLVALVIRFFW